MASRKKNFKNILDYVYDFGISSFEEVPFFDLDASIFATLAYLELEKYFPVNENFKRGSIQKYLCEYFSHVRINNLDNSISGDDALALAIMSSNRFKDVKITKVCSQFSIEDKVQFYAIEFLLSNGIRVISYRGTDLSITGWEENAGLVCFNANTCQKLASTFLETSFIKNKFSFFYVVGHSKGGNLAVFASSLLRETFIKRLINVYSFDGPGLMDEIYDFIGHKRIQNKIVFIVPEDEMVGMLMKYETPSYVVSTATKGDLVSSHYILNWKIEDNHFVRASDISSLSKTLSSATEKIFADYLGDINVRIEFFKFFFDTVKKLGITDPKTIFDSPVNFFFSFSNEVRKSPNKKLFIGFLKAYISNFGSALFNKDQNNKKKVNKIKS